MSRGEPMHPPGTMWPYEDNRAQYGPNGRDDSGGLSARWLVAGLVAAGLAYLAWHNLGPDLKRYMKMRNM